MMKKNLYIALLLLLLAVVISGCARSSASAPVAAGGEKVEIVLLSHRGDPATMNERQYQFRIEVGEWMERDLLNQLRRSGYETRQITSRPDFTPKAGRYLLEVTIDKYNPGAVPRGLLSALAPVPPLWTTATPYLPVNNHC